MAPAQTTPSGIEFLRTPDDRFDVVEGFPYEPRYIDIDGLRMAYVEEGPAESPPILLLHGEPTWSYLYRRMIPPLLEAGHRIIAPDLIGFGRSDKPTARSSYTYAGHVAWMAAFLEGLGISGATLFGQDWGGLIGLRVVAENPDRFDRIIIANTVLPDGSAMSAGFMQWQEASQTMAFMNAGQMLQRSTQARELTEGEMASYAAPFPAEEYMAGARQFPLLVPTGPDDTGQPGGVGGAGAMGETDADPVGARRPGSGRVSGCVRHQDPRRRGPAPSEVRTGRPLHPGRPR